MDRIAFAIQIARDQEADFRASMEALREAFDEFASTRAELGLILMEVWQQRTSAGLLVLIHLEGHDLHEYFIQVRTASGIDAWLKQKIEEWSSHDEDAARALEYPQSEQLFMWREGGLKP